MQQGRNRLQMSMYLSSQVRSHRGIIFHQQILRMFIFIVVQLCHSIVIDKCRGWIAEWCRKKVPAVFSNVRPTRLPLNHHCYSTKLCHLSGNEHEVYSPRWKAPELRLHCECRCQVCLNENKVWAWFRACQSQYCLSIIRHLFWYQLKAFLFHNSSAVSTLWTLQ